MKYILLIALLLCSLLSFPQDCTKELLAKKPGIWKTNQQGSIHEVGAADLAKEKAVIAGIHKMISSQYKPVGCEAAYSTVYGKNTIPGQLWIADPYYYMIYILRYVCDQNSTDKSKYDVDISTSTTVTITANEISSLNSLYAASIPEDDSRGYFKLRERPQKKEGYYYTGEVVAGDQNSVNRTMEYRWLITYGDTLPFSLLSRKEYLMLQRKKLDQSVKDSPGEKEYLGKFQNNIIEYLKKPESELSQPAICMWNDEERFEKFVPEGTKGSFIAVKPNLAYYRKNLPKSSPQFFNVVYTITMGDPVFDENIAGIKKAVDLTALRNMLGK
jgi:hypothetical protein